MYNRGEVRENREHRRRVGTVERVENRNRRVAKTTRGCEEGREREGAEGGAGGMAKTILACAGGYATKKTGITHSGVCLVAALRTPPRQAPSRAR